MKIYLIASPLNIDPSRWMLCCHYSWVSITCQAVKDFSLTLALETGALFVKLIDCRKPKNRTKRDADLLAQYACSFEMKRHVDLTSACHQLYLDPQSEFTFGLNVTNVLKTNPPPPCENANLSSKEQLKDVKNGFMQNGNSSEPRSIEDN